MKKQQRRQKPESERRSKPVQVYLTPGEYYELQQRADERRLSASAIIRRAVFDQEKTDGD